MTRLIGICGKAGSGKDTLAGYLAERHGYVHTAFANPLKAALSQLLGVNPKYFHDRDLKEQPLPYWGFTPRYAAQHFGQDLKPALGPELWFKRWYLTYQTLKDSDDIVVSDVRFDLEADAIRELGGYIIHLERNAAGLTGAAAHHPSEVGATFRDGDFMFVNNGTLEDLYAFADNFGSGE